MGHFISIEFALSWCNRCKKKMSALKITWSACMRSNSDLKYHLKKIIGWNGLCSRTHTVIHGHTHTNTRTIGEQVEKKNPRCTMNRCCLAEFHNSWLIIIDTACEPAENEVSFSLFRNCHWYLLNLFHFYFYKTHTLLHMRNYSNMIPLFLMFSDSYKTEIKIEWCFNIGQLLSQQLNNKLFIYIRTNCFFEWNSCKRKKWL